MENDPIKAFANDNKKLFYALRDWINLKVKDFSTWDALRYIWEFADGKQTEVKKIIKQLTEKRKLEGRGHVYDDEPIPDTDIVRDENKDLKLINYDPKWKPMAKGQKVRRNPNIFKEKDGQIKKTVQKAQERLEDIGERVRAMNTGASNDFITKAIAAVNAYAKRRKKNPHHIMNQMERGRLKLYTDSNDNFMVVPALHESRVIVITESTMNDLRDELEMTEYKFNSNVKKFLHDILEDPVNAEPSFLLKHHGLNRNKLLKVLSGLGMIEKEEKLSDKDADGNPKTVTMKVKYRVPKKGFENKLKKMFIRMFERNVPQRFITEDGEGGAIGGVDSGVTTGATSAENSGQFSQPVFGIYSQSSIYKGDKDKKSKGKKGKDKGINEGGQHQISPQIIKMLRNMKGCENDSEAELIRKLSQVSPQVIYGLARYLEKNSKKNKGGEIVGEDIDECTTTSTVGDYTYDYPPFGDKESCARHNGKGRSVSVNIKK